MEKKFQSCSSVFDFSVNPREKSYQHLKCSMNGISSIPLSNDDESPFYPRSLSPSDAVFCEDSE